jgi:hypothetical protein
MAIIARIGKQSTPVVKPSEAPSKRIVKPVSGPIVARAGKASTPVVKPAEIDADSPRRPRVAQHTQTQEKRRDGPLRGQDSGVTPSVTWKQGSKSSRPTFSGSTFAAQIRRPAQQAPSFTLTQDILELVDQLRRQASSIPTGARLSPAETVVDAERFKAATIGLLLTSDPTSAISKAAQRRATIALTLVSM